MCKENHKCHITAYFKDYLEKYKISYSLMKVLMMTSTFYDYKLCANSLLKNVYYDIDIICFQKTFLIPLLYPKIHYIWFKFVK